MICPNCGIANHPQAVQCSNCGIPLYASDAQPNSRQQPPRPPTNPPGWMSQSQFIDPQGQPMMPSSGTPSRPNPPRGSTGSMPQIPPWDPQSPFYVGPTMQQQPSQPDNGSGWLDGSPQSQDPWIAPPSQRSAPMRPEMMPPQSLAQAQAQYLAEQQLQHGASGQWDMQPRNSRPILPPVLASNNLVAQQSQSQSRPQSLLTPGAMLQGGRLRVQVPYGTQQVFGGRQMVQQWVAIDNQSNSPVVLMELVLDSLSPQEAGALHHMLTLRLRAISAHPNLQHVLGSFSERGRYFIVLEAVEGMTLRDKVQRQGALTEAALLEYGTQMVDALTFLDRQSPPAMHGMISPDTLVISTDAQKITLTTWTPQIIARTLNQRYPGGIPQIDGYTSPEQQRGQFDIRNDLYSVGVSLYYAATTQEPAARSGGIFPPARQFNQQISAPTEAVLARAVRFVLLQRYQHPENMASDIANAQRGERSESDLLAQTDTAIPARRNITVVLATIISLILITVVVGSVILRNRVSPVAITPAVPTITPNPTALALYALNEGVSDGGFIFDKVALPDKIPDGVTKTTMSPIGAVLAEMDGAKAYQSGNIADAVTNFQQAVTDDPSNPEARLYLANAQIASARTVNFITVAVAASFSGQDLDASRQVLRGIALAQQTLNSSQLPGRGKIRIAIASVGGDAAAASVVANFFTDQIASGNKQHFVGIVSWSPKDITPDIGKNIIGALQSLEAAQVPLIAPVRTTDTIPSNPYFFQLSASNQDQSKVLAQILLANFKTSRVVIVQNPNSVRSLEVAGIAKAVLTNQLGSGGVILDSLDPTTSPTYTKAVRDVGYYGADSILYLGGSSDLVGLAVALNKQGIQVPILGALDADAPEVIGVGDSDAAQLARSHTDAMQQVHIINLTDPGVWQYLAKSVPGISGKNVVPTFFNNFTNAYTLNGIPVQPDSSSILAYDALTMTINALVSNTQAWTDTQLPTPQNTRDAIASINGAKAYQGISGKIDFDPTTNIPNNRSEVLKDVVLSAATDAQGNRLLDWSVRTIINGIPSFCIVATGTHACGVA